MNKKYYYELSLMELEMVRNLSEKPKLLLHVCCAPCSIYVLQFLGSHFDLTLYFNNDNIYPESEYQQRLEEVNRMVETVNKEYSVGIEVIVTVFKGEEYHELLSPYAVDQEGGKRCLYCYRLRMEAAYHYAAENSFDYFTTVMTMSRQKNSQRLNEIGQELERQYPQVKYFYSDFKKDNGLMKRNELVKKYQLYEQLYCGCRYSYAEYLKRIKEKEYNDLNERVLK